MNGNALFENLIRKKTVAIIGPSPILGEKKLGPKIESADTVVRMNAMPTMEELMYQDYGKRCDILYCNILFSRHLNTQKIVYLKNNGVQLIVSKYNRVTGGMVPYKLISYRDSVYRDIRSPLLGMIAIYDILRSKPKKLYIYGFDFYKSNKKYYSDAYHNNSMIKLSKQQNVHNISANIKYFKTLYKRNDVIIQDDIKNFIR